MTDEVVPGPVDFILIEFPTDASTSSAAEALSNLLYTGVVRLYDIVVIRKSSDGRSDRVDLATSLPGAGAGGQLVASERIPAQALIDALEAETAS